jgi:hypothetical protein
VKSWFAHKGEDLYNERKSLRNAIDLRFLKGMKTTPANDGAKTQKTDDHQPDLFGI